MNTVEFVKKGIQMGPTQIGERLSYLN